MSSVPTRLARARGTFRAAAPAAALALFALFAPSAARAADPDRGAEPSRPATAPAADPALLEKLNKAVSLIKATQNKDGGWRYQAQPYDADVSVTACQLVALNAARRAGADVDGDVIARAVAYVKTCQDKDGGFDYLPGTGASGFARTAAAVAALRLSGAADGDAYARAAKYLATFLGAPGKRSVFEDEGTPAVMRLSYGGYYLALAAFSPAGRAAAADDPVSRLYPLVRDALLARQAEDGSWHAEIDRLYDTPVALIVLQMPDARLALCKPEPKSGAVPR